MKSRAEAVGDWLAKAASDLRVARREAAAPDPATDAACFHCQQAVEKLLKAWLLWCGEAAPRVHNLATLLDLCREHDAAFGALERAVELTPYAVEVRYGDEPVWPTREELAEALAVADDVARLVVRLLRERGVTSAPVGLDPPPS